MVSPAEGWLLHMKYIRVRYSVEGLVRFISHLDLMRVFFRACLKGGVPVAVSQGFSPHLKLSFGPPRGVGVASSEEYVDINLTEEVDSAGLVTSLGQGLPRGITIHDAFPVRSAAASLAALVKNIVYSVIVPPERQGELEEKIRDFSAKESIIIERQRPKGKKTIDLRPLVQELKKSGGNLEMRLALTERGSARPLEILACLWPELGVDELRLWLIRREKVFFATDFTDQLRSH